MAYQSLTSLRSTALANTQAEPTASPLQPGADPAMAAPGPAPAGGYRKLSELAPGLKRVSDTGSEDDENSIFGNLGISAVMGVTSGVEAAGALIELVNPEVGSALRRKGSSATQALIEKLDPEYQEALNKSWLDISSNGAVWDWRAWASGIAQQIPYMIGTMGLGEVAAVGIKGAATLAGKQVAGATARKAGYTAAAGAAGAGEAAAGVGRAADEAGLDEDTRLAGMGLAAVIGAPAGMFLGQALGNMAGRTVKEGLVKTFGKGAASEAIEEGGTQAGTETGKASIGLDFDPVAILEAAAQGGAMGGATAGLLTKPQRDAQIKSKDAQDLMAARAEADRQAAEKAAISARETARTADQPKLLPAPGGVVGAPGEQGIRPAAGAMDAQATSDAVSELRAQVDTRNQVLGDLQKKISEERDPKKRGAMRETFLKERARVREYEARLSNLYQVDPSLKPQAPDPMVGVPPPAEDPTPPAPQGPLALPAPAEAVGVPPPDQIELGTRPAAELESPSYEALMSDKAGPNSPDRLARQIKATETQLVKLAAETQEAGRNGGDRAKLVSKMRSLKRRLDGLRARADQTAAKQERVAMAGPDGAGQQQIGLFPELPQQPAQPPQEDPAVVAMEMEELLDAIDQQLPDPDSDLPLMDVMEASIKRSQRAKAAAQARWAKRANAADSATGITPPLSPSSPLSTAGQPKGSSLPVAAAEAAAVAARSPQRRAGERPPVAPPQGSAAEATSTRPQVPPSSGQPAPPTPGTGAGPASGGQAPVAPGSLAATPGPATTPSVTATAQEGDLIPFVLEPAKLPPVPKPATRRKAMSPTSKLLKALADGPRPAEEMLGVIQHALALRNSSPIVRTIIRLRKAFPDGQSPMVRLQPLDPGVQGLYDPKSDTIYLDPAQMEDPTHVLLHEAIHAATLGIMRTNPKAMEAIQRIMMDASEAWYSRKWRPEVGELRYFFSAEEFIAEALTNSAFADKLAMLKDDKGSQSSVWVTLRNRLWRMLGVSADTKTLTAFDRLLEYIPDQTMMQEVATRKALLEELDRLGLSHASAFFTTFRSLLRNTSGLVDISGGRVYPSSLPVMGTEQIARSYGDVGREYQDQTGATQALQHDTINDYYRLISEKGGYVKRQERMATQIVEFLKNVYATGTADPLDKMLIDARMWSLHPELTAVDPKNAFGIAQYGGVALHRELTARWAALTPDQRDAFALIRDSSSAARDDAINQMVLARLRGLVDPVAADQLERYINDPARTQTVSHAGIDIVGQRAITDAEIAAQVGLLGLPAAKAAEVQTKLAQVPQELRKEQGPYVPLRRYGSHFVILKSPTTTQVMTRAALDRMVADNQTTGDGQLMIDSAKTLPGGMVEVKSRYETVTMVDSEKVAQREYDAERARWAGLGRTLDPAKSLYTVKRERVYEALGLQAGTIDAMRREIEAGMGGTAGAQASDMIFKFWLERLPDTSVRKAQLQARKVQGASTDMLHVFSSYARGLAYFGGQMRYGHRIAATLGAKASADVQTLQQANRYEQANDLQTVINHFAQRESAIADVQTADLAGGNGFMTLWNRLPQLAGAWLLTGPGTMAVNAMQPWMMTLPFLGARYSYPRAAAALTAAYKDVMWPGTKEVGKEVGRLARNTPATIKALAKGRSGPSFKDPQVPFFEHLTRNLTDPSEKDLIRDLADEQKIDVGLVADLQALANRVGRGWNAISHLSDAAFIVPQAVETINRTVTALAAYRLAKAAFPNLTYDQLKARAGQAIDQTQFNYSADNRPTLFQNQFLRAALVFKTYPQNVYYTILRNLSQAWNPKVPADRREAVRFLAGFLGLTVAGSGIMGVLAIEPLYLAAVAVTMAFTDDDDPEEVLRNAMAEWNEGFAESLIKGVPFGTGWADLGRMGLPQLLPVRDIHDALRPGSDADANTAFALVGQAFLGAPGGVMESVSRGAIALAEGEFGEAARQLSPKAFGINDAVRTWEYAQHGATDSRGYSFMAAEEIGLADRITRAMGFEPAEVAEAKALRRAYFQKDAALVERRTNLLENFADAVRGKDKGSRNDTLRKIKEFNRQNPARAITRDTLMSSLKSRAEVQARMEKMGVAARGPGQIVLQRDLQQTYR